MASSEDISTAMEQLFIFKTTNAFVLRVQPAGMAQACALSGFLMALLKGNTDSSTLQYLCTVFEQTLPPTPQKVAQVDMFCTLLSNYPHFLL